MILCRLWDVCRRLVNAQIHTDANRQACLSRFMCGMSMCVHVCVCVSPTDPCVFLALLYVLLGLFEWGLPLCVAGIVLRVSMLLLISMATLVYRLTGTHPGKPEEKVDKSMKLTNEMIAISSPKMLQCHIKPISVCTAK